MSLKGIIFDFDGLILDTELPGFIAWKEIFDRYQVPFTFQHWHKAIGTGPSAYDPAIDLCSQVMESLNPDEIRQNQLRRAYEILEKTSALPGVLDVIEDAKKAGIKMAVASSSPRDWVINHLTRLELVSVFDFILTAEDVLNVKPQPDLFQLALKKLGISASEAVVFEDSPNGIKAARAAGIFVIVVPNEITKSMDTSEADRQIGSFEEITLSQLIRDFETSQ